MTPLSDDEALALAEAPADDALFARAARVRDESWGRRVTYSPKVFLPLTNLCRNHCDYCSFRRSPGEAGAWTMSLEEVDEWLDRGREQGALEALICLGDRPETAFRSYREKLASLGFSSTVDYVAWASERALARGLLPHSNAGLLTREELARLRPSNPSVGLMLENVSERLCEKGMPHHRAPDKRPARRLAMLQAAGELRLPFTSGILVGIGETPRERVESLLALRRLHRAYGHLQEVIVQNFTPRPEIAMSEAAEAPEPEFLRSVALARLILEPEVSVQAPPNLNPTRTRALLRAGINDFGGISPVTPDYISPRHPWPHVDALARACEKEGFHLAPRAPIYPRYVETPGWVDEGLLGPVRRGIEWLAGRAVSRASA
ncbi:MAG: 7,8-didemethyl-8-hydroxy-5-deazariboflavin synthase CofG [Sorangiineae bacterium]|nr:7,8-didemethyl-8-hydroxy-5-deazariboflavin synthase CofG [Polyangiaceae bacterium]MEB2324395.1 7,8-didemethyl-8-hydroxy-5-deazariboflavin synthase CofG [Sorangiineae bacterium]